MLPLGIDAECGRRRLRPDRTELRSQHERDGLLSAGTSTAAGRVVRIVVDDAAKDAAQLRGTWRNDVLRGYRN